MDAIVAAADRWLRLEPSERASIGPDTVARCGEATRALVVRLTELGYPVEPMLVGCADDDVAGAIAEFEASGVVVPPALVEVWRRIGGIAFVDLGRYGHMGFWEEHLGGDGRLFACDGVVIEAPGDDGWIGYVLDVFDEQADGALAPGFPVSPDDLHKDNTSGGDPYELVPNEVDPWMATLRGFSWGGTRRPSSAPPGSAPDLVSYLRTAMLECGGFPGLFGSDRFEPLRREADRWPSRLLGRGLRCGTLSVFVSGWGDSNSRPLDLQSSNPCQWVSTGIRVLPDQATFRTS